jgi:hypothetical protein
MENLSQLSWFIILPLYTNSMPWYSKLIQQLHHYRLHWLWELFHPLTEFIPSFPEINWHQANTRYLWNKLHDEESYQWELCWAIEHPETKQKKIQLNILQQWNKSFTPNFSFITNFISQQIVLQIRLFNVIRNQINQNPCLDLKVSW